ncbi:MAG: tRNA1(Val) (adenine(37)-N6)-methyltransferase [Holosporales bacterium]
MFATTRDSLLAGQVILEQPQQGYRVALDPVLLAASLTLKPAQSLLDLGCGVGAVFLCAGFREPTLRSVGLELQPDMASLARRNIQLNGLAARASVVVGNALFPPFAPHSFDHVVANPPYYEEGASTASPHSQKKISHQLGDGDLMGWVKTALQLVKTRGKITFILPSFRCHELLGEMSKHLGDIQILPIYAKADRPAERVILSGRKGVRTPLKILPGLVLHESCGAWTPAAREILEAGRGLTDLIYV